MSLVPTPAQIRAQVAAVLDKPRGASVIGIRVPVAVDMGESLVLDGQEIPLARCESVLEVRERLASVSPGEPLASLTPLMESELGADVVARLAKHHLFSIEPWLLVRERFKARHVDPRLVERYHWVARVLLDAEPPGGYTPAPSGFLDAERVWRVLFEALLGLPEGGRDPEALLEWSVAESARRRAAQIDPEVLAGLAGAVEDTAGALARRILDCASGPNGVQAVAVGLVARVLFGPEAKGDDAAIRASGRLEAWLGGGELPSTAARGWADASESVIRQRLASGGMRDVGQLLDHADALLAQLGAGDVAHRSAVLKEGFEQRLARFGDALEAFARGKAKRIPPALSDAAEAVQGHVLSGSNTERQRAERVEMALRLARWLATVRAEPLPLAPSFAAAAKAYRQTGGHVDWARNRLWESEPLVALSQGYSALLGTLRRLREAENQRFGELLANWTSTGSHDKSVIPVEDVLARVVTPIAETQPVLLLVLDGMGMAVFRELERDLVRQGWAEIDRASDSLRLPVIAALPTVTEASRASLLAGKLMSGTSAEEKEAFAKHPGLASSSEPTRPPVLYHKGDLSEAGSLGVPATVFNAIDDPHRRVIGVVINAVDDHLTKGEQLRVEWRAHSIRPLEELLSAARAAGRVVILVSDHGHVLEHDTVSRGDAMAERWREAADAPSKEEVLLHGPRVLLGGGRLIAPWSEAVRLGRKKTGYHGGAAPQEVVIPLGLFVPPGLVPAGWQEVDPEQPDWWDGGMEPSEVAPTSKPAVPAVSPKPKQPTAQGHLFPIDEEVVEAVMAGTPEWIGRLMASELMATQRRAAARIALPEERICAILTALDERGGKMTRPALAKRIGVPVMRVGGVVSALRRVLNVDGYDIVSVDDGSDTVVLNREFLDTQFGL